MCDILYIVKYVELWYNYVSAILHNFVNVWRLGVLLCYVNRTFELPQNLFPILSYLIVHYNIYAYSSVSLNLDYGK